MSSVLTAESILRGGEKSAEIQSTDDVGGFGLKDDRQITYVV